MKKTMTNKKTTSYSALKNRDYERKVYSLDNSVNYYRHRFYNKNDRNYFVVQKTKQVKKIKEDAFYKSVSIENVDKMTTECTSDEIHTRIDSETLISKVLCKLDDRRRKVIQMRYAIGYDTKHTRVQIAKEFNISTTYAEHLEYDAMRTMKKHILRQQ